MLLGGRTGAEGAQVPSAAGLRVHLARVEAPPAFAAQLADDHGLGFHLKGRTASAWATQPQIPQTLGLLRHLRFVGGDGSAAFFSPSRVAGDRMAESFT